jgi:hypothetical protein
MKVFLVLWTLIAIWSGIGYLSAHLHCLLCGTYSNPDMYDDSLGQYIPPIESKLILGSMFGLITLFCLIVLSLYKLGKYILKFE